ncbi:MAG TPA: Rossmann-like and DUF2520 domain-containing protein [Candidatus Binatia bacterium]|nr:Rossmann-like and DUF2520 domain-containing protein [Candidatus Binatia bacterium]
MTETERQAEGDAPEAAPCAVRAAGEVRSHPTVGVVGAGRAGTAMAVALASAGYRVVTICSRDPERSARLAARIGARAVFAPLEAVRAADLTLLTVPDTAISGVAAVIAESGAGLAGRGIAHCSACVGSEALMTLRGTGAALGCLHPLQSLSGEDAAPLLRGSLMAIEADPPLLGWLEAIARDVGGRPVTLEPGGRALYHAAAVLAGNAPLALLAVAAELLEGSGLSLEEAEEGLAALMAGAVASARRVGPRSALTGPIVRGDAATVARHLGALNGLPEAEALYRVTARETLRLAGPEGREEIARLLENAPAANGHRSGGMGLGAERRLSAGSGYGSGDAGVRAERRLGTGAGRNRAETRAPSASQGARVPGPTRSTTPGAPPHEEQ